MTTAMRTLQTAYATRPEPRLLKARSRTASSRREKSRSSHNNGFALLPGVIRKMTPADFTSQRHEMVQQQLRARGIVDETLLDVMAQLPREVFIPSGERAHAYEDRAVGIGEGQTISQPYIVAFMTETLCVEPKHGVLEVGTGSGYQTAILAQLANYVLSVERIRSLREHAEANLAKLGIGNVALRDGDGTVGVAEFAPYDRILVTAGAPQVPGPLLDQLADQGRLVIPVGGKRAQTVTLIVRAGSRFVETPLLPCRFVKLIGRDAWTPD